MPSTSSGTMDWKMIVRFIGILWGATFCVGVALGAFSHGIRDANETAASLYQVVVILLTVLVSIGVFARLGLEQPARPFLHGWIVAGLSWMFSYPVNVLGFGCPVAEWLVGGLFVSVYATVGVWLGRRRARKLAQATATTRPACTALSESNEGAQSLAFLSGIDAARSDSTATPTDSTDNSTVAPVRDSSPADSAGAGLACQAPTAVVAQSASCDGAHTRTAMSAIVGLLIMGGTIVATRATSKPGHSLEPARPMVARESCPPASGPFAVVPHDEFLEKHLAEVHSPALDEIIRAIQPIPSIEELARPIAADARLPFQRTLRDEGAHRLAELEREAYQHMVAGEYDQVISTLADQVEIRRREQGDDHWQTVNTVMFTLRVQKTESLDPSTRKELWESYFLGQHVFRLWSQGQSLQALPMASKVFQVQERCLGNHPDTAIAILNLGALYRQLGDLTTAERLFRDGFDISRRACGIEHPDTADQLAQLGSLLAHDMHDPTAGEPLLRKAVAVLRDAYGPEHDNVTAARNALILALYAKGHRKAAEQLGPILMNQPETQPGDPASAEPQDRTHQHKVESGPKQKRWMGC